MYHFVIYPMGNNCEKFTLRDRGSSGM